jgi:hypothetical protein
MKRSSRAKPSRRPRSAPVNRAAAEMVYRVAKVPLPPSAGEIEQVINQVKPPGHVLVTMSVEQAQMILVFGKAV